jgi:hypothetical protein
MDILTASTVLRTQQERSISSTDSSTSVMVRVLHCQQQQQQQLGVLLLVVMMTVMMKMQC